MNLENARQFCLLFSAMAKSKSLSGLKRKRKAFTLKPGRLSICLDTNGNKNQEHFKENLLRFAS